MGEQDSGREAIATTGEARHERVEETTGHRAIPCLATKATAATPRHVPELSAAPLAGVWPVAAAPLSDSSEVGDLS